MGSVDPWLIEAFESDLFREIRIPPCKYYSVADGIEALGRMDLSNLALLNLTHIYSGGRYDTVADHTKVLDENEQYIRKIFSNFSGLEVRFADGAEELRRFTIEVPLDERDEHSNAPLKAGDSQEA